VNLDDCWERSRDAQGTIQPDPIQFPSGIPALVDYVHSRKLKFDLYSGAVKHIFIHYLYIQIR
jgi:alpha-galactosidase